MNIRERIKSALVYTLMAVVLLSGAALAHHGRGAPGTSGGGGGGSGPLALHVSGNKLIAGAFGTGGGATVQLRGGNMSALEFVGVQGFPNVGQWGGVQPAWNVYQTWKPTAVRIPLNVESWLGMSCMEAHGQPATSFTSGPINADPQGNYKQTVIDGIASAQAIGARVILDLHWSAPIVTLGGVTSCILADGQPSFMNASTDLTFWQSIANTFGTQAVPPASTFGTIQNAGIIFELFNEPYLDFYVGAPALYTCMLSGCNQVTFNWAIGAYDVSPSGGVQMLGYQQALNGIRATGAKNVIIANGPTFTQSLETYTSWIPTDTLSPSQVALGWHPYPSGNYPYSDGNVYGRIGNDTGGNSPAFSQWAQAALTAGIPVIITEDGGNGGSCATSGEPHMTYMANLADSMGMSYVWWQWNNPQASSGCTQNYGTTGTVSAPTPIQGEGQATYNWMTLHPLRPGISLNVPGRLGIHASRASNDDYFQNLLKDAI